MTIYNIEKLRDLIPLYVNGSLSETERKNFESGLETYSELREELKEFSELKSVYTEMTAELPTPSDRIFQRTMNQIKTDEKIVANTLNQRGLKARLRQFFEDNFNSLRLSWGVAAVQLAIILMLVVSFPTENRFTTLTSSQVHQEDQIRINIVFNPQSTEQEIRSLLTEVDAMIVSGPTMEGLYTVEVKNNQDIDQLIKDLKGAKPVKFIQRAFSTKN